MIKYPKFKYLDVTIKILQITCTVVVAVVVTRRGATSTDCAVVSEKTGTEAGDEEVRSETETEGERLQNEGAYIAAQYLYIYY